MKLTQKSGAIALIFLLSISLASCQFNGIKGSGHVITVNRNFEGGFTSIKAEKGLDVTLEQAGQTNVSVVADDNVEKHIRTTVNNGVLNITCDINNFINVESKKIVVKAPSIQSVETSSGVSFNSKNTIKGHTISLKSSSGSSINMAIESDKAFCETSSGSTMIVSGKAIELETAASSGSSINAKKLLSNDITASASSGSSINVYPLVSLKADASSGGNVNYHNVPKNLNKQTSSGGAITKQ